MTNPLDRAADYAARAAKKRQTWLDRTLKASPDRVALRIRAAAAAGERLQGYRLPVLEAFYTRLTEVRRIPEDATEDDFRAAASDRSRFYALMKALKRFAPEVPLVAARGLQAEYDRVHNATYGKKPAKERTYDRVAWALADWPEDWRAADARVAKPDLLALAESNLKVKKPLDESTVESTRQAVGLFLAALDWARGRGVALPLGFTAETAEVFARFIVNAELRVSDKLVKKKGKARSAVMLLERVRRFARRGFGLSNEALRPFTAVVAAWEERAALEDKEKVATLDRFHETYSIADIPHRAAGLMRKAAALPGHGARALRLRHKAALFALTINAPERLGDLHDLVFGQDGLRRHPSGVWALRVHQKKTRGRRRARKSNPELWPETGRILDALILGDREKGLDPVRDRDAVNALAQARYEALQGAFFMTLERTPAHVGKPSVFYREEFGISEHMIRTLVTDFMRRADPRSAAACQALLGHTDPTMHEAYVVDFPQEAATQEHEDVRSGIRRALAARRREVARGESGLSR